MNSSLNKLSYEPSEILLIIDFYSSISAANITFITTSADNPAFIFYFLEAS